jgi:catechol 2,3-dioxygenase-like lactoylglutathione lyase family enzyme
VASEAVFYVRELDPMVAFYVRRLDLSPADAGDGYQGLRADGFTVWLLAGEQHRGGEVGEIGEIGEIGDAGAVERRSEVPVKLCFEVPSIELAAAAIRSLGGSVAPQAWKFGGFVRQDVADPEGNVLQLLERCS